ncbi:hypothetical protein ROLI_024650 [Roseobacter fucihabitans]|uniref:N-acetylglucosaminyltransferase n=1 Tax=Roseobacter fucihabitans TaxID=1537242 RepID=A0ABZ2BTN1_9RHOB|nr:hypothetical protein [Roseobacter litoralis]MBC6965230.1 Glycosyltransferase family 17 [Roseobacter litoralis]
MKIFDCFVFHDELDLLEIRLSEMSADVDFFVIAEAALTFTGQSKPSHLKDNWGRFEKWHSQMIHVFVTSFPETRERWTLEKYQRDQLVRGLEKAEEDDIVLISDVDEIISAKTLTRIRSAPPAKNEVLCLEQRWFQFFLDNELYEKWLRTGPRAALRRTMNSPQGMRNVRGPAKGKIWANALRGLRSSIALRRPIKERWLKMPDGTSHGSEGLRRLTEKRFLLRRTVISPTNWGMPKVRLSMWLR